MAATTSLKSDFTFLQPFKARLFLPTYLIKSKRTPLELNFYDPYPSSQTEIKFRSRLFTSSIKCIKLGNVTT